jgi:hypothetical protein
MTAKPPDDPFIDKFKSRVPRATADSFTPAQLDAIKLAFGARSWGSHAIDLRLSIPLLWARFYLVLLVGRERRPPDRRSGERPLHPITRIGNAIVVAMVVVLILIPLFLALYAAKSTLGIKLFPDGGAHALMRDLLDQIVRLFQ